jgi:cell division protein FtsX
MTKLDTEKRDDLNKGNFAFAKQRKEPLEDATHVRNAVARFNQVEGVSAAEKDEAWKRIQAAAKKYGVELSENSRHDLGKA